MVRFQFLSKILLTVCLVATWAGNVFGQVSLNTRVARALSGIGGSVQTGDFLILAEEAKPTVSTVGLIEVTTEATMIRIKASDAKRNPVALQQASDRLWIVTTPGKVWIEVSVIDFDRKIWGDASAVLDVGAAPDPIVPEPVDPVVPDPIDPVVPDPVVPDPVVPDNPEFPGLVAGVRVIAAGMSAEDRQRIRGLLGGIVDQMIGFQLKTPTAVAAAIVAGYPQTETTKPLYEYLRTDAAERGSLSWEAQQMYYETVAEALR